MSSPHLPRTYYATSLDPIHVGTGEFRLGRVDNTIVRDPATKVPKIPGSSIAGVARAYSAMNHGKYPGCAGKSEKAGPEQHQKHCGNATCPVCTTFGFSLKENSFQGLAQFSDARVLFFPVASLAGPVWITSPDTLADAGFIDDLGWTSYLESGEHKAASFSQAVRDRILLGWLSLGCTVIRDEARLSLATRLPKLSAVIDRLVLVDEEVFSVVVEDQLEVRTSVSISPLTGAAEKGALFTMESIPRATVFFLNVTVLSPNHFSVPGINEGGVRWNEKATTAEHVQENVASSLALMEYLGVGGSNTRGMGRLRVLPHVE